MEKGCKAKVRKINLKGDQSGGKRRKKSVVAEGKEVPKVRNTGSVSPINSRLGRNKENLTNKGAENPPDVLKVKTAERRKKRSEGMLLNITKRIAKNWTAKTTKAEKAAMKKGGNLSQGLLRKIHTNRLNSSKIIKKSFKPTEDSFKTPENKSFQIEKSKLLSDPKLKLPEIGYFCKKVAPLPFCLNSLSLIDNKTEESFIAYNPFSLAGAMNDHESSIEAQQEAKSFSLRTHLKHNSVPERFTFDTFPNFEEESKFIEYPEDEIAVVNGLENQKAALKNELTAEDSEKVVVTPRNHKRIMHEINFEEQSGGAKTHTQNFSEESFMSPPRAMKTFCSPDSSAKRHHEPKAPRKFYTETDSPGSFNFSLSSDSELLNDPFPVPKLPAKDQSIQTDLLN